MKLLQDCDNDDRLGFVSKVYGILATQLIMTFGWVTVIVAKPELGDSLQYYPSIYILALVLGIAIQCAILCCMKVARTSPANYILLFLFTLCYTYLIGYICAFYDA